MQKITDTMRVVDIIDGTTVDGPGFRTSIYFAGCHHKCPGCHNPTTWDPASGKEISIPEILERIERNGYNVTFSGGDPLYQIDQLVMLAKKIKEVGKSIWLYTGFTFEQIIESKSFTGILPYVDVVVDGPFLEAQRDITLLFRGSANQRLIDVTKWIESGEIKPWSSDF